MSEEMRKLANEEMKFPDEEVELSKEELVEEAKSIMEEVNSDQKVVDRPLPVNLRKNIDKRILALNAKEEKTEGERFSAEERELMRLGKLYKKKRKMRKYFVLAALCWARPEHRKKPPLTEPHPALCKAAKKPQTVPPRRAYRPLTASPSPPAMRFWCPCWITLRGCMWI